MGLATVYTRPCSGVDSPQVAVEVHLSGGLLKAQMVGSINPMSPEPRRQLNNEATNASTATSSTNLTRVTLRDTFLR